MNTERRTFLGRIFAALCTPLIIRANPTAAALATVINTDAYRPDDGKAKCFIAEPPVADTKNGWWGPTGLAGIAASRIRGIKADTVVFDEVSHFNPENFDWIYIPDEMREGLANGLHDIPRRFDAAKE